MAAATKPRYSGLRAYSANPPRLLDQATYRDLGVTQFHGILCELCKTGLWDVRGNPRWDFVGGRFVCPLTVGCGGEGGNR